MIHRYFDRLAGIPSRFYSAIGQECLAAGALFTFAIPALAL
jgi:hypothetical protein